MFNPVDSITHSLNNWAQDTAEYSIPRNVQMCFVRKIFRPIDKKMFGLNPPIWKFQFSSCSFILFFETLPLPPSEFSLPLFEVGVAIFWSCTIEGAGV